MIRRFRKILYDQPQPYMEKEFAEYYIVKRM